MVSAILLRDLICGSASVPYPEVFDPGRFDTAAVAGMASMSGHAIKALGKRLFQVPTEKAAEIPAGQGGIVTLDGEKVGVYKDEDGTLYSVDICCNHMGCQLEWNPDEVSWDCPCHGSRYDRFGNLISGPAQEGLAREEPKDDEEPETP
jgi:Rieske Fe-S protein